MSAHPTPDSLLREAAAAFKKYGFQRGAAHLGLNPSTFKSRVQLGKRRGFVDEIPNGNLVEVRRTFERPPPPDDDLTVEEMLALKKKTFARKKAAHDYTKLIPIKIKVPGPICIGIFGDPHIDDDGCDVDALERDLNLITDSPFMLGLNIGDVTNNWVGRLERKYADQMVTKKQATKLIEWFVRKRNWLAHVLGNHDLWNGGAETFGLLLRGEDAVMQAHGVRMALAFPKGPEMRIHARHDFPGASQFSNTHGMRRETLFRYRDHILVAGHKHVDEFRVQANSAEDYPSFMARVSGYKRVDDYVEQEGFHEYRLGPSIWFVLQPDNPLPVERIKPFWDGQAAKDYTEYLRRKK